MKIFLKVIVMLACGAIYAQAQKPNFNGTWKLNLSKSFLGNDHPESDYGYTKTIAIMGNSFSVTDIQVNVSVVNIPLPDSNTTTDIKLDGTEQDQQMAGTFPGTPSTTVKVSGEWQGGTVFIQQRGQMLGGAMILHQRYFLSEDGSQLIELIERHSITGDKEQRLVFEKN